MCTRPKLLNIGYYNALSQGLYGRQALLQSNYRFCPCGMCIECRNMRREEWTQRLKHEIQTSNYVASFITLTYRDDELPLLGGIDSSFINYSDNIDYDLEDKAIKQALPSYSQKLVVGKYFGGVPPAYGSTLSKSDAKQFCDKLTKRFRRKYGKLPLKYICAGEYGDDGHRPHLHLIIVGLPASERQMVYDTWNKGRIDIEPVGNGAIRYVLSYIDKQVFGSDELYESYGDFQPPFILFSKGIGEKWNRKNIDKFDKFGKITFGDSGKSYTLNPYYRKKYGFSNKRYVTPFSDSIINYALQHHLTLSEAYEKRCKLRELELQHKQIKKREPLYICSKSIIKKDWSTLKNKKNVDLKDCQEFTRKYLKRDEFLIFKKEFLKEFDKNINQILQYNKRFNS